MPDGRIARFDVPEGTTPEQAQAMIAAEIPNVQQPQSEAQPSAQKRDILSLLKPEIPFGDIAAGALRGAGSIGATLIRPFESKEENKQRREAMTSALGALGADTESGAFAAGKIGGEIAGTAGAGGVVAKGLSFIPALAKFAPAVQSGGFTLGKAASTGGKVADKIANAATRTAGGAITGGATAGLINPEDAGLGAAIGGAMPGVVKGAGALGSAVKGEVSDAVINLANKAKSLGIDIPADRIANSRPLNALAASLNYVPFSGRAATEKNVLSQYNKAVSKTFGQDSDNVTMALRKAHTELGKQFDDVLTKTSVKVDNQFLDDLARHEQTIANELDPLQAKVITNQIGAILDKSKGGVIDGQAAYNIKKTLDRIGNRNSNEAYYAKELKKSLMGALNRSLPEGEAEAFSSLRKQYGNMMDIDSVARNGAEGGVSIAKMANMRGINNPEMQDLADIAAQFLITRESPHGAAQRVILGALGVGAGGAAPAALPYLAGGVAAGKVANSALNSNWLKGAMMNKPPFLLDDLGANPWLRSGLLATSTNP